MKWFEEFVSNIIGEWLENKEKEILKFEEFVEMIYEKKTSFKIGNESEEYVKELVESKNYHVHPSPGSKSPSDLWCISSSKIIGEAYHLALIQVKGTENDDKPYILNENEIIEFRIFSSFVLRKWNELKVKEKPKSVIISCGYVGVLSEGKYKKLYHPKYYSFWYPIELKSKLSQIEDYVEGLHYLK